MKLGRWVKKITIWIAVLGCLGGLGLWIMDELIYKSDLFLLRELQIAEIEGEEQKLSSDVKLAVESQLKDLLNHPIWSFDLLEVQARLEGLEWISEATVQRWFPSGLKIFVKQKRVVANYLRDQRRIIPVAQDGSLMSEVKITQFTDRPFLRGEIFEDLAIRKRAIELVELFPREGSLTSQEISEIFFSEERGFELQLVGGLGRVLMGVGDFQLKATRVGKVVEELQRQGVKDRVIDARYASKVIVKQ